MMAVALSAAISVGLMSCSKDKDEVKTEGDYSWMIMDKWEHRVYNFSQSILETLSVMEFKSNNKYYYVDLAESYEGDYRVTENKKTEYMQVTESFLIVDSTVIYYELDNNVLKTWEIVNGTINYIDGINWPIDWREVDFDWVHTDSLNSSGYQSGRILKYTRDSTVIVADTTYRDAYYFKILVSGSHDFDQLGVWNIDKDYIVIEFYSKNDFVAPKPKWFSRQWRP